MLGRALALLSRGALGSPAAAPGSMTAFVRHGCNRTKRHPAKMKIMAKLGENLYKTIRPFKGTFLLSKPKVRVRSTGSSLALLLSCIAIAVSLICASAAAARSGVSSRTRMHSSRRTTRCAPPPRAPARSSCPLHHVRI